MTREGLPTGKGTAATNDVADPHPSTEENNENIARPGVPQTPHDHDIGPNSYAHDGKAPPWPKNKGAGPR
jgi:hypothetical protein